MGVINFFDLNKYNGNVFIETGTGIGDGLQLVQHYNFDMYHSCEIESVLYNRCIDRFRDNKKVKLYNTSSMNFLKLVVPTIPKDQRIIFWLDAHFPGADYISHSRFNGADNDINMPLIYEMEYLFSERHGCNDTFLMDDLHLLEPYNARDLAGLGIIPENGYKGVGFLDQWLDTHILQKHYVDQGYIELVPRDI